MGRSETSSRSTSGGRWAIAALVAVMVALVVPAPASADAPVASTTTMTGASDYRMYQSVEVAVRAADNSTPTGVVVISEGSTELIRATLEPYGTRSLVGVKLNLAPGSHPLTFEYLGSAAVAPSSGGGVLNVANWPPDDRDVLTGTLRAGPATVNLPAGSRFGLTAGYDKVTGELHPNGPTIPTFDVSGNVAGSGPVSLAVREEYDLIVAFVNNLGRVNFWRPALRLTIDRITVGGETWATDCSISYGALPFTGQVDATGMNISATFSTATPLEGSACDGRGDLVNALLGGAASYDFRVAGAFPLPVPQKTPTQTTLTITPPSGVRTSERVELSAAVTTIPGFIPHGTVLFKDNGVQVASAKLDATGVARTKVPFATIGTHQVVAEYQGLSFTPLTTLQMLLPSSSSVPLTILPPPTDGRAVTGTMDSTSHVVLPAGGRLLGATYDAATGTIGAGRFWFPRGEFPLATGVLGPVNVRYRLVQLEDFTGAVSPDGTVAFTPATFRVESSEYSQSGTWRPLYPCDAEPIELTLAGTVDGSGLHLSQQDAQVPALPAESCGGNSYMFNQLVANGVEFSFDVAGSFALPTMASTTTTLSTWFNSVDEGNQTVLTARVVTSSGAATGSVAFSDGGVPLGTVPVGADGSANLVVSMNNPGTRTVTATYSGDGDHSISSGSTVIQVNAVPPGASVTGSFNLGAMAVPVAPGSRLSLVDGSSDGGSFWLASTTVGLNLAGYGTVTADVRLVQAGGFGPVVVGGDGSFTGLEVAYTLQVRSVTTGSGTVTPLGCNNRVDLSIDGSISGQTALLTASGGTSTRNPNAWCTGPGKAVIEALVGPASANLTVTG